MARPSSSTLSHVPSVSKFMIDTGPVLGMGWRRHLVRQQWGGERLVSRFFQLVM